MSEPATLSIAEARAHSPKELLDSCRARMARWQPRINAFVSMETRHAGGKSGALAGIPLAHKDMFYRAGKVSNCGSKIRKGWVASQTAAVLERLDAAGAADIGTLNMAEFAYGPTGHNEHWGDCCNPWKPEHITGGSVRVPAAACGVTGLKTTWGRVSRHGAMPLSHSLDTIGPVRARPGRWDAAVRHRDTGGLCRR